jgi:hypothetical protein
MYSRKILIITTHIIIAIKNNQRINNKKREWKKIEFPKEYCTEFGNKKLRRRPRNRWQDDVREDGRIVGGEG